MLQDSQGTNNLFRVSGSDRAALEVRVAQVLDPGEKLLWVGLQNPWRNVSTYPLLAIALIGGAALQKDFQANWMLYVSIIVVFTALFCRRLYVNDRDTILALTDSRLLTLMPNKNLWWRKLKDVKSIESTVNGAGRGIVRFRFDNVEFGVGPHGTGQTVTSNLPMTFDVLTDGNNLRELVGERVDSGAAGCNAGVVDVGGESS